MVTSMQKTNVGTKKILFICDWDFTLLWEKVARQLKENKILGEPLAVVVGRNFKDYLDKSSDNPFLREWYLPDILEAAGDKNSDLLRLRELEKKYANPTLWRYLWADRSFVRNTYRHSCRKLVNAFNFYEDLYQNERPDLVLIPGYGSMAHVVSHFVARHMGIPMLSPVPTRISDSLVPGYDALERLIYWQTPLNERSAGDAQKIRQEVDIFLANFRNRPERPVNETILDHTHAVSLGHLYRFFRYAYRYWISGNYAKDHTKPNPIKKLWLEAVPKIRRRILSKNKNWEEYNPSVDYVYFPLHLQPEATTMLLAPFYLDQLSVIENIAKSVPIGYRVVVKEHPQMLGRRPKEYYDRIKGIANVVVISPFVDSFTVIRNAKLIFTITGTAGMEGLILGKPVITLGSVIYNACSLVKHAANIAPTLWAEVIRECLANYQHDDEILKNYLQQVFATAYKFWFLEPLYAPDKILSNENVNCIAKFVENEFEKVLASPSYGRPGFKPKMTIWERELSNPVIGKEQK